MPKKHLLHNMQTGLFDEVGKTIKIKWEISN